MEENHSHNQGYWFVVREDQGNVIFSSNNVTTIQTPQIVTDEESRYIIEPANRNYEAQIEEIPVQLDTEEDDRVETQPKKEDTFWDRTKIGIFLTLCLDNKNVEKETLWNEISSYIGASPEECSIKYRQLRRTYLRLLRKKRAGKSIKWVHYNICEEVFSDLQELEPSVLEPWDEGRVRALLSYYIEFLPKFRNSNIIQKDIWKEIGVRLGTTGYNCYHKFKNLRRSYLNWINRTRESGKGLKWPYQEYFERIYFIYSPPARSWDRRKVKLLLEAYAEIAHKFKNPKLQKKELWADISRKVGETPAACDKKFRNLKQTYIRLKNKTSSGRWSTKWRYFRDFEAIYGSSRYLELEDPQKLIRPHQEENYIKDMLEFYIAHKHKFRDPLTKNRTLWKMIAPKLGLTPEGCDKKFRNLKATYIRLAWKKRHSGKDSKWPYMSYFDRIYGDEKRAGEGRGRAGGGGLAAAVRSEVRRAVRCLRERRDADARFERLAKLAQESNDIQRERNRILRALLDRK